MNNIELKHNKLINKAKKYMRLIYDYEHDISHMYDVIDYTYELLNKINIDVNKEVCIISAYWHDVGRLKCSVGHEKISAEMLKEEMKKQGYDDKFINECYIAIENHKWNMTPQNNEGLIVKDADKLAWLGNRRWDICLRNKYKLDSIVELLPTLKKNILYFNESKEIYDKEIVKLVEKLYYHISIELLDK